MRTLLRHVFTQEAGTAVLTITALLCLPLVLRREAPDAAFSLLMPVTVIGAVGAFVVLSATRRGALAVWVLGIAGAMMLFIRIGQMGEAVETALQETLRVAAYLLLPSQEAGGRVAAITGWIGSQGEAWSEAMAFASRCYTWLASILQGLASDDPPARALWLGLGLWVLAAWAAWRLKTKDDPLGGLLPTTAAIAFTLDQTVQNRWPLWLHLGILLGLVSITHLAGLIRTWRKAHTDYSDSIREDSLLGGGVVIALILAASFTVSSFSLHDFLDRFRREQPATTASTGASGEQRASARTAPSGAAGLQTAHIISAGPQLSEDVVMYVRTGDLPPMPPTVPVDAARYYWRDETYDTYNGRAWSNRNWSDAELVAGKKIIEAGPEGYRKVHATVEIPAGVSGAAYWAGTLVGADMPLIVAWRPDTGSDPANAEHNTPPNTDIIGAVAANAGIETTRSYAFDALLPQPTEAELGAALPTYPDWVMQRYLQLPESVPERVRALARDLTVRGRTPYDRAVSIEQYLRQMPYSLDVPAPPSRRDAADYFLFDLKEGYCDYYATAMTVLARAAGLPARLVTGYASGSYDSQAAEYIVRAADAHAWTEVYFSGIGWVEFEPTAGQPLPKRETTLAPPVAKPSGAAARPKWFALPALPVGMVAGLWWLIPLVGAMWGGWLLLDGLRLNWMSPEAVTRTLYRRLERATLDIGGGPFAGKTVLQHATRVRRELGEMGKRRPWMRWLIAPAADAVSELTGVYMLSLFAPAPLGRPEAKRAADLWRALRWRLPLVRLARTLGRYFPRR